jgi:hypothetical protein
MVTLDVQLPAAWLWLFAAAEQADRTLINRLPPTQRARILMALLALVVVGIALVALAALGARWYRTMNASRRARPDEPLDAWARTPQARADGADDDEDTDSDDTGTGDDGPSDRDD